MARFAIYLGLLTAIGALANNDVDVWYVNVDGAKARETCMNSQLKQIEQKPNRHRALRVLTPDCTVGGVKNGFMTDYDEQTKVLKNDADTKFHIISNWCSHKQLFSNLYKSNSTSDFFVVLEDDAVLDDEKFMPKIREFIDDYSGANKDDWQMVQIDFYGSSCKAHRVGAVGGKTVFKPRNLFKQGIGFKKPLKGSQECAQYFGGQALLVRKSEIPSIVENMEQHQTVPLDWLPAQLPRGLAWKPNIAYNSRSYKTTKGYNAACKGAHFGSDIAKAKPGGPSTPVALQKTRSALRQIVAMSDGAKKARKNKH